MNAAELLIDLTCRGVQIRVDKGRLAYSPRSAVDSAMIAEIKRNKTQLMKLLEDQPIQAKERHRTITAWIEFSNRRYRGGSIDWTRLDSIERRITKGETQSDVWQAVAEYIRQLA